MATLGVIKAEAQSIGLHLLAVGAAVPGEAVTNDDMAEIVDTSDKWITSRTGIKTRYFCRGEKNVDLAYRAALNALVHAGIRAEQVGVLIVTTFTPDQMSPSVACALRARLKLPEDTVVFDLNAACAGFLYGLQTARQLLLASERPYALIVGSETISRVLDFTDRSTCVLFGDGAGAAVAELSTASPFYWLGGSREDAAGFLGCSGLWDKAQSDAPGVVHMQGQEVFRFAVDIIPYCIDGLLQKAKLKLNDIDYVVCHQANVRIISHVVKRLSARPEQFFVNLQRYGNTSSASIPLALNDMRRQQKLKPGARIICVGFGAGFTWAACLLTW